MTDLPKTFDPAEIESRWYAHWEESGSFRPDRPGAEPWTIVNPPPNVTGNLHIGHALDNTLQDILARHARLKGKDALWVVGTDHAGIATQMVVERQMAERQQKVNEITQEQNRLRENMKTVAQNTDYYTRLMKKLNDQETQIEGLQKQVEDLQKQRDKQRKDLEDYLADLNVG